MGAARLVLRPGMRPPAAANGRKVAWAVRGDTLRAEDPVVVARWPPRGAHIAGENAASMALEVGEGAGRSLLAADVDSAVEVALATGASFGLLKVAHHGAGSSSGARALSAFHPRLAAISCGRRNPFGHPDPGALARLAQAGAETHRTDREGTLWFEIGPGGATLLDWRSPDFAPIGGAPASARPAPANGAPGGLARAPARW